MSKLTWPEVEAAMKANLAEGDALIARIDELIEEYDALPLVWFGLGIFSPRAHAIIRESRRMRQQDRERVARNTRLYEEYTGRKWIG